MSSDHACPTFRKVFLAFVFGVGVFLIPNGAQSATNNSATLQWVANQESDLAGYRIYHGTTPGNYGISQNAGMTTTYQYVSLESNKTHYFSVTAYDTSGNESSPSPEVSKTITGPDSLLSLSVSGEGNVTSSPVGVSCSRGTCSGTFSQGSSVTLSAAPSSGSTFSGWSGACTGTGSCVVALSTSSASVSVNFVLSQPSSRSPIVNPASLTQEEIKSQAKLAKIEQKKQAKLAKLNLQRQQEVTKLELQGPKVLAKLEDQRQKVLAKLETWETKQKEKIAKIDQELTEYLNMPNLEAKQQQKLTKLELQRQQEVTKLELQGSKVLAKLEDQRQKVLANLEKWESKQEVRIAKIDQIISKFS